MPSPGSVVILLQRVSGLILWAAIAPLVGVLQASLSGDYATLLTATHTPLGSAILALLLWALLHYLLTELRSLGMECGLGITTASLPRGAWAVMLGSPLISALLLYFLL